MPSTVAVNSDVEAQIMALAGITVFDPGTMTIDLVNTLGPKTTVHVTISVDVDTTELLAIIKDAAQQASDGLTPSQPDS